MKFESIELDKETLGRLADYGTFISNKAPPLNREKALVLLGEAMLDTFFREFMNLWRNELFPDCLLKNYEASDQEVHEWVHSGDPQPDCKLCSKLCKEVDEKMDENVQTKLENYLELLDKINSKVQDEATAVILVQEIAKDQRMNRMIEEREAMNNKPATFKQKKFMDDLGIKYPKNISKQEASALIDEELGKNGG